MNQLTEQRPDESFQLGGQAVIEGVMIRSAYRVATAVRRKTGPVTVHCYEQTPFLQRRPRWNVPVLRGFITLIETVSIGIRSLNFSAEMALKDLEDGVEGSGRERKKKSQASTAFGTAFSLLGACGIALFLFFLIPLYTATALFNVDQDAFLFNVAAGVIRVGILIGYLLIISRLNDVDRIFQYHGAEHKVVFLYEKRMPFSVENARIQSRFHPRCGTSFVLQVALIAILCFAILDWLLIRILGEITFVVRVITHLPLIPIVAGMSYEVLKLSARYSTSAISRILSAPGLWLQRITTREPDDGQLEVALMALRTALASGQDITVKRETRELLA